MFDKINRKYIILLQTLHSIRFRLFFSLDFVFCLTFFPYFFFWFLFFYVHVFVYFWVKFFCLFFFFNFLDLMRDLYFSVYVFIKFKFFTLHIVSIPVGFLLSCMVSVKCIPKPLIFFFIDVPNSILPVFIIMISKAIYFHFISFNLCVSLEFYLIYDFFSLIILKVYILMFEEQKNKKSQHSLQKKTSALNGFKLVFWWFGSIFLSIIKIHR